MEPRIQYAKASDGVNIAYWAMGEGPPLVHLGFWFSHIQMEWQFPEMRRWYEHLAARRRLIRYDLRGGGLSDRGVDAFSLDRNVEDLTTVVDRLNLDRFALFGAAHSAIIAMAYAAQHPERVSRLVLWCPFARGVDWLRSPQIQAIRAVLNADWQTYTETAARILYGWSEGEPARRFAELIREAITHEAMQILVRDVNQWDVTELLPRVSAPTLLAHRRQLALLDVSVVRSLAAQLPDARLALLEGAVAAPYLGDTESVLRAIDEFLDEDQPPASTATPAAPGGLVTILFTDIEGSTALTQRLGDAKARELLREHERIVREALAAHGGSEVKTMGDGFMASFGSASSALDCAIAMQRAFAESNAGVGASSSGRTPVHVRIGVNAGEPIAEEDPDGRGDLFGTAVIMAERICGKAAGGEILVSNVVRELVAGKRFLFSDRGETALRGFEDPVRLYEARWQQT